MFPLNTSASKTGEIPADKSQSAYRGSVPTFGGGPQFGTSSVCHRNAEDSRAFASFANSDFQTFGDLAQCGANQSFSNQGHQGNEIGQFEKTAENKVNRLFDDQMHRGYEIGEFERKEGDGQFSGGDLAAKGETDDEDWSHGHRKTKIEESETRKSSFEEVGFKLKNTSLTNTPFHSTHSPQKPPLRPPTFTIGSGSDQHSEGHAFSEGDPKVASHGFNIQNSQIPNANLQDVGEIQADGHQSSHRGFGSAPRFGERPQFGTGSPFQNQAEFQNTEDNPAFAGYGYSGSQTFARLAQCGGAQSFSDQGHRAAKGETDDEDWSHGHRKTKTEKSETRKSEPPLRPPTFTIGSGSDQHSEGHAFSEGDPKVASHGFNIQNSQIPYANQVQGVGEIQGDGNQSSLRGIGSAPRFGERPQFGTGSSFQNQSEFQNTEDNPAFAGYGYSGSQTFARLAQCGSTQSYSDQGHRAAKGEKDDEDWSHGNRKTKVEESETRKSSFEELGFKFKNTSLTNTPFHSTHSPQKPPLRPPTFTIGSGSDQHSEGHAFSEGDPKVASHGFNIQNSQIPYANRHGVGESPADGSQSSYTGFGPAPAFGGRAQFGTRSSFQKQSEFHQNAEDSRAFVGYGYSGSQTFGRLAQCESNKSFSDQGHRAAKGETDDEEWSHGHRKIKTEESETRKSSFEELGFKFENTSLTNTPFKSTYSPQKPPLHPPTFTTACGPNRHSESSAFSEGDPTVPSYVFKFRKPEIPNANQPPLRPPTFTTASGSNRHSESSAFSEGDPTVPSYVFNFRKPEIPSANRHGVGEIPDRSQSSYRGFGPVPVFGGRPQFGTGSSFQNQSEFHQNAEDCRAFVGYEYSDNQTFEGLTQCGGAQSFSDQGHRETPKK